MTLKMSVLQNYVCSISMYVKILIDSGARAASSVIFAYTAGNIRAEVSRRS